MVGKGAGKDQNKWEGRKDAKIGNKGKWAEKIKLRRKESSQKGRENGRQT